MFTARVKNANGEEITLTQKEQKYQVINIEGLDQPPAQVNFTDIAGMDGSKFNSAKLASRNVVITIRLTNNAEENRLELYRYFRTKENITFYYKSDSVDVFINGYVETVECAIFSNTETMQVSVICPFPYFSAINEIVADISNQYAAFTFPFSIDYDDPIPFSYYEINRITNIYNSGAETGLTIEVDILDSNIDTVKIINTITGEYFLLEYDFAIGDKVIITTLKGQKNVKLIRNGEILNIFGAVQPGTTFLQLATGGNEFGYSINDGDKDEYVYIVFKYYNLFRGV